MARILLCCSNGQLAHIGIDGLQGEARTGFPVFFALTVPESVEEAEAAAAKARGGFSGEDAARLYADLDALPDAVREALAIDDEATCTLADVRWSLAEIPAAKLAEQTAHREPERAAWWRQSYLESCIKDAPATRDVLQRVGLLDEAEQIEKVPLIAQVGITAAARHRLLNEHAAAKEQARDAKPVKEGLRGRARNNR